MFPTNSIQSTAIDPDSLSSSKKISRREFLYYLLGASAAVLTIETAGAAVWYALPRARWGVELFRIEPNMVPLVGDNPSAHLDGEFWLVNQTAGLIALHMRCPYDNQLVKWVPTNYRFECPQCGSKYQLEGTYIEGPSRRHLDRFPIYVETPQGRFKTPKNGAPVRVDGATQIVVDTSYRILMKRF